MKRSHRIAFLIAVGCMLPLGSAHALTININYDSSVNSAPSDFKQDVAEVVQYYESHFNDPATVTINVGYGEVDGQGVGGLGASLYFLDQITYAQTKSALVSDAKTSTDTTAVATLPASDPLGGAYWISQADAKALSLTGGAGLDGYVGFATSGFDYNNTDGVTGFDFIGTVAHEISEVMGRELMVGASFAGTTAYTPLDLFRYSSAGVRNNVGTQTGYFSTNSGTTNINNFYTSSNGDFGDWLGNTTDSYNAFGSSNVLMPVSAGDLTEMDTIGYDGASVAQTVLTVSSAASSPSTGVVSVGSTVTFTVGMTEPVKITGTPTLTLNNGATATYVSGSGTNTLTFSYTVAGGQATNNLTVTSINLNGGTIEDGATNDANLSLGGLSQSGPQIVSTVGMTVPIPVPPPTVAATPVSSSQINLSWLPTYEKVRGFNVSSSTISTFQVFRGGVQVATTTTNSYADTGLTAATPYTYTVTAVDSLGATSSVSASVTATTWPASDVTAPTTPSGLTAIAISPTQVNLSWSASTDDVAVTGYQVLRGGVQVATTTATTYTDTGLSASTPYTYTIKAADAAYNVSSASGSASATTLSAADTTPPSVSILVPADQSTVSGKQLTINTSASDNIAVAQIDIKIDGTIQTSCVNVTTCNFTISTSRISLGSHIIDAVVRDTSNNMSTTTITVTQ